jgi:signal transduction histidine kinase
MSDKTELTVLRNYFWILLVLWTVLVGSILFWTLFRQKRETGEAARIQARNSFEKDLVYRRWAASHGGVYVPTTDKMTPNPYLSHIEESNITTPSGRILTLVNPAYMTRQVHEMGAEQYGLHSRITSLKPIRAANAADEWETKALQAFEQGIKEVSSIEMIDNQQYMRLMRPMITEQGCLKCHAEQGYKVGDLRGGISVAVPMEPIQAIARRHALTLSVGDFLMWLLGVGGIGLGWQRLKQRIQEHKYAEEQIENLAKFPSENKNPVLRFSIDGTIIYANNAGSVVLEKWGCSVGERIPQPFREQLTENFQSGEASEFEFICNDGRIFLITLAPVVKAGYVNAYGLDITERKKAEEELKSAEKELTIWNKVSEIFLTIPDEKIYEEVLQAVLETMESKFGIFGYIDEHDTLIIPSMTRDVWEKCQIPDKTIVYPKEKWGGIWGRALVEKRSLFANQDLHVPEGHIPITSVLVVPIMYTGKAIGLLEVANKSTDYSHKDQEFLESIASKIAPILNARLQRNREERERKKAEEELKKQRYYLAKAQDIGSIGTWELDIKKNKLVWTDENYRIFGLPIGTELTYEIFLSCVHPDDREYVDAKWKAALNNEPYDIEHRLLVDGNIKWVREKAKLELDEKGNCIRGIGFTQDTTRHKQAEIALQNAKDELETRVQERTNELANTVEVLQSEVIERKRLEKEVLEISEEEQRRIGRELHDGLQQELVGMTFECQLLNRKLTAKSLPEADHAAKLHKGLSDAIDHTRAITRMLYPVDLDSKDISFALEQLASKVESLFHISCKFSCKKSLVVKRPDVAINIYRIVQEAVTNAIKHGEANRISISLKPSNNKITFTIRDNGTGLAADYDEDKGMGLRIMKYRASMIGASLNIKSGADSPGTLVTCSFENR